MGFLAGTDRGQISLLPPCVDDYVAPDALVRVVDAFVASLNLANSGSAGQWRPRRAALATIPAPCCVFISGAI